jgi:hypothetical protein
MRSLLRPILRRLMPRRSSRRPEIRLPAPGSPELHLRHERSDDARQLVSQLCRFRTLDSETFRGWLSRLREPWRPHRKLWEWAYICQALDERGMLRPGRRGLGFAVGAEPLPSLFASMGCEIVATDLAADDERRTPWERTGQWVGARDALNRRGLCDGAEFAERVRFRPVDMNELPDDLAGFDFTWSSCSFEHCGTLELGLRFLERQMSCLQPGGVAVHTTEFNLSSNSATVESGAYAIYRLRDIEAVVHRLQQSGHRVEPLELDVGAHALDRHVDAPPYRDFPEVDLGTVRHLRLDLNGFASSSIGLIVTKGGPQ